MAICARATLWLGLAVDFWHVLEFRNPWQASLGPDLPDRTAKQRALFHSPHAQGIGLRILRIACINGRAANLAERMHSFGATVGGLGVAMRISAEEVEALRRRLNVGPERRPGQGLAVKTVADIDSARLDLCFVGDRAAVALSVDLHRDAPIKYCYG